MLAAILGILFNVHIKIEQIKVRKHHHTLFYS